MATFAVILPAAGRSSRFRDKDKKPFVNLDGRAVWLRSVELFVARADVSQCIIVVAPEDQEFFRRRYQANLVFMNVAIADGGAERFESVANALALVKPEVDFIAIHDAVRPCLAESMVSAVFTKGLETGAALLAIPVTDTVKQADDKRKVQQTVARKGLWLAQTPQVFRRDWLVEAYARRGQLGKDITDDAQLMEAAGHPVHLVEGATTNIKITTRPDLTLAEAILKAMPKPKPAGPAHPFAEEEMWGGKGLK
ncbi:MAG TPA: 2-C-methyl-D-erythritol 4-phosphate cytidylyltransferase [Gemmataceae bacterium]|jgi:2-C-methyl-D-erythritol 4-phosphate cytidylyltransferase|nr:2-C-methyl-D-erythritol 4-phosphate cytidylyltransferase [Gemmataceae bacterium]